MIYADPTMEELNAWLALPGRGRAVLDAANLARAAGVPVEARGLVVLVNAVWPVKCQGDTVEEVVAGWAELDDEAPSIPQGVALLIEWARHRVGGAPCLREIP